MISTLTPTITRTINPNIIRNVPGSLPLPRWIQQNNSGQQNDLSIQLDQQRQQAQQRHNQLLNTIQQESRNIIQSYGPGLMAPRPSQYPTMTKDDIQQQKKEEKLSKVAYNKNIHGTNEEFQKQLEQAKQPTQKQETKQEEQQEPAKTSLQQQMADVKEQLRKNQLEEGKSPDDPIFQQVLQERAQLAKKLADLAKQRNKERQVERKIQKIEQQQQQSRQEELDLFKKQDQRTQDSHKAFSEEELQEIQKFSDLMRRSNISEAQQEIILQDIQQNGLLPFDQYDKYDARNYLRNPNKKQPNNEPDNEPDNNNDDNEEERKAMEQATLNNLQKIIEQPDTTNDKKQEQITNHINQLQPHEINILMNIYNVNNVEDTKNQTHGHIDADAILTSLIQ